MRKANTYRAHIRNAGRSTRAKTLRRIRVKLGLTRREMRELDKLDAIFKDFGWEKRDA